MNAKSNYIPALKYNWVTQFYDELLNTFLCARTFKTRLIERFKQHNPKHLLDIGCGTATLSWMMGKIYSEACIAGFDGDENTVATVKQKEMATQSKIRFIQTLSYSIPVSDANFIMRRVFHLILFLGGVETTTDKVQGKMPKYLIQTGFKDAKEIEKINTIQGIVSMYQDKRPNA